MTKEAKKVKKSKRILKKIFKIILKIWLVFWYIFQRAFFIFMIFGLAWWLSKEPSLHRDWQETERILPEITFSGNIIDVKNVRNFEHITLEEYKPGYYDESYDLEKLETVHYIVEPFSEYDGPAHTMLSFGFSDNKYVSVSAELRKEKGEEFDAFLGLMNQYELVYIVGSDNDLIKLRANVRKDTVRMYPVKATKEQIQMLFSSVMHRADKLSKEPEFYNTLWNTCTTSILLHVNSLRDNKISSRDLKILLPANSDKIGYDLGLIDTKLSFEQAREYYKINDVSEIFKDSQIYSEVIRKEIK